ncbi:MAG: pre-peptidase C-terminal domain-containing protein [Hyphomicrobiales bacterium]|nr:pre-peptidase C-terminal domain-containing protein [Hyphomicrobiales bacterium]
MPNHLHVLPRDAETDVNSRFDLRDRFVEPDGVIIDANLRTDGADRDYFEISGLPGGTFYEAEVVNHGLDSVLGRFDRQGNLIETDDDSGQGVLSRLAGIVPNDGVLNVAVSGFADFDFNGTDDFYGGPHGESGAYQLEVRPVLLPRVSETDINSRFQLREPVSAPQGVIIDANLRADGVDRDYFEVSGLQPGSYFEAEMIATGFDTLLGRFDANGSLTQSASARLDGLVPADGILNLAVSGYPDFDFDGDDDWSGGPHGQSGDYQLVIRSHVVPDDIPSNTTTTASLAVGGTETSIVDFPHDENWFRTSLESGRRYTFALQPDEGSDAPLIDPYLRLYDAAGTLIATDDDGGDGLNSSLDFEPVSGGTYYVSAGGYDTNTGDYALSLHEIELTPGPVMIEDVPAYDWYHGCAPTAAAMIFGYWDQQGFANTFVAETFEDVLLTQNVQDHISSPAHNAKYDPTPDDATLPIPTPTGIADFMGTSIDPLQFGYTWVSNIAGGIREYADFRGYAFQAETATNTADGSPGGALWDEYVAEINAGRPAQLTVDTDGNGAIEHCVTGIGYEDRGSDGLWYAMFTTWSESETALWRQFQPISEYEPWSVGYLTTVHPGNEPAQISSAIADNTPLNSGPVVGSLFEPGGDPLDVIASALESDGAFDQRDAKIYGQAKSIDFLTARDDEEPIDTSILASVDSSPGADGSSPAGFTVSDPDSLLI